MLALALALLNASLTLGNIWPTPFIRITGDLSLELAESGTTVMFDDDLPQSMTPVCCKAKLLFLPCYTPVTRSTAE